MRERKYSSGCQCGICPSQTDKLCAQQTANLLSEKPGGIFDSLKAKAPYCYDAFALPGKGGKGGIFRYLSCFFFLRTTAAAVAAPPLASSRAIHKERLLVSPVGGVFGSFAVTVSALAISLVPSLPL